MFGWWQNKAAGEMYLSPAQAEQEQPQDPLESLPEGSAELPEYLTAVAQIYIIE